MTFTVEELDAMPEHTMVRCHWPDASQADLVVLKIPEDGAGESTRDAVLLSPAEWRNMVLWSCCIDVMYQPPTEDPELVLWVTWMWNNGVSVDRAFTSEIDALRYALAYGYLNVAPVAPGQDTVSAILAYEESTRKDDR